MEVKQTGLTRRDYVLLSLIIIAFISFLAFLDARDYYDKSKLYYDHRTYRQSNLAAMQESEVYDFEKHSFTGDTIKGMQIYDIIDPRTSVVIYAKTPDGLYHSYELLGGP